jgi:hypothetical protein
LCFEIFLVNTQTVDTQIRQHCEGVPDKHGKNERRNKRLTECKRKWEGSTSRMNDPCGFLVTSAHRHVDY